MAVTFNLARAHARGDQGRLIWQLAQAVPAAPYSLRWTTASAV